MSELLQPFWQGALAGAIGALTYWALGRLEELERYLRLSTRNDKRAQMVMEALL